MEVADRIIVLNKGNIEQIGTPEEIYNRPATPFVYDFIGHANVFHGSAEANVIHIGDYSLRNTGEQFVPSTSVAVYVRPHNFALSSEPKDGYFEAKIAYINAASAVIRLELRSAISEQQIQVEVPRSMSHLFHLEPGLVIYAKPTEFRWFSK